MLDYRFVCVDAEGRWQDVRYAALPDDMQAKGFGCDLLREFPVVVVYQEERKLGLLAKVA